MDSAFFRPPGLLAGFHATRPDRNVPELRHVGDQRAPRSWAIGRHRHKGWELYLQIDGHSTWEAGTTRYALRSGEAYAVSPGFEHRLLDATSGDHHYAFLVVHLEAVLERIPALTDAWAWSGFRVFSGSALRWSMHQLVYAVGFRAPFRTHTIRLALDQVVLGASRGLLGGAERAILPAPPAIAAVIRLIDREPGRPWSLGELAKTARMSPSRFSETFARCTGRPPLQYLRHRRVEIAQRWLATSHRAVTDIALELGFASSQHFAKTFRHFVGTSAREYRMRVASPRGRSSSPVDPPRDLSPHALARSSVPERCCARGEHEA